MKKNLLALAAAIGLIGFQQLNGQFGAIGRFTEAAKEQLVHGNARLLEVINQSSMPAVVSVWGVRYRQNYQRMFYVGAGQSVTINLNVPKANDDQPYKAIWIASGHGLLSIKDHRGQISAEEFSFLGQKREVLIGQREIIANAAERFKIIITNDHITRKLH